MEKKIKKSDTPYLIGDIDPDLWVKSAKEYEDNLNIKELSRMSEKKLKKGINIKKKENLFIISQSKKVLDLSLYYNDPERYFYDLFTLIRGGLRDSIHEKDISKNINPPYYIAYRYPNDEKVYKMSNIHFIFNMIIWMPLFIMGIEVNKDITFHEQTFNNDLYIDFLNNKIIEPYKHLVTHNQMSKMMGKMYDIFIFICEQYGLDLGLSFSLYDFLIKWNTNKEIYDLNHTKIPKNMSIRDSEKYLNDRLNRYIELMMDDKEDNVLKPLLRSKQGISTKQLREFVISGGFKPDLSGNTYPIKPRSNLLTDGYRNPTDYVIDAVGGRKAGVLALAIDQSGYLARSFSKSAMNLYLNPDPNYDCHSVNYYIKEIKNKSDLNDMVGRWYLEDNNHLVQVIPTDYHLVGRTLKFRSPATCASKNGICATCYGHLYSQNRNINIGLNSSLKVSERTYQNTMSAKHILSTSTESLNFSEEFNQFFEIVEGYRIMLREDIENPENYLIKINKNLIYRVNEIDDLKENEYIQEFIIYDKENEKNIEISELDKKPIFIGDGLFKFVSLYRREKKYDEEGWISIEMEDLNPEEDIFFVALKNNEITKPLKEMKSLIEKGKEIEGIETISELIDKLTQLMRSGGIKVPSIHIEILARNLIRDKNDILKTPDYTKENPEYVITSIHNSIIHSNSVINSLTFERLKQQLSDPTTYRKDGVSPLDKLFVLE